MIRRARTEDAVLLARLGRDTFIAASADFGVTYRPEDMAAFLDANHTEAANAVLLADPDAAVWIAEKDGEPVGYAAATRCDIRPIDHPDAGEIRRLYLAPQAQGTGLGAALMTAMLEWLEERGLAPVYVSAFSKNPKGLRFYRRFGFEKIAEYEYFIGEQADREFILRRGG